MSPTLRPYQRAGLDAVVDGVGNSLNRLLLKLPTGTGKTVMFAELPKWPDIREWLESFPVDERKMLVIAHREELLDQAARKIHAAQPHARIDVEQGERYASRHADVIVASIQTLLAQKFKRMKRLLEKHTFRIVIVDEAHHAAAPSYRTALAMLGFLPMADASTEDNADAATFDDVAKMKAALDGWDAVSPKDRILVGVTATPNRSDAIGLGCVFQTIAYSYDLKQAIEDGWLSPIVPWVVETDTDLDGVRMNRGEFNQKELAAAVNQSRRNKLAVAAWEKYAPGLPTIAFTVDVAHAHALAAEFTSRGVKAEALSGETPKDERRDMLRRYEAGDLDVITNCMVLTEGTDLPTTACILHAKPTKSPTLYEQMTGRGLRIHPSKTQCIVIDVVDVARKHTLQTAPVLYGLPPSIMAQGKDLRTVAAWLEDLREKQPGWTVPDEGRLTLEQLQASASTFDIWTIPVMSADLMKGLHLNWTPAGDGTYRLQYPWEGGNETIIVTRDILEKYTVLASHRAVVSAEGAGRIEFETRAPRTLAASVATSHEALVIAEQFVAAERRTVAKMTDRDAAWRTARPSEKQLKYLRRLIPKAQRDEVMRRVKTSGDASDMIGFAIARSKRA